MKYIYCIFIIFIFVMVAYPQQDSLPFRPTQKFGISVHQPYFTGNNVYAEHHDESIGFGAKAGFSPIKNFWIDFRFSQFLSKITNKLAINSSSTNFKMLGLQFSYDWQPVKRLHFLPLFYYEGIRAKNQGKFSGHGGGLGLELELYVMKDWYFFAGGQYSKMFLNISAPSDIEKEYSRGQFFSFYIGTGSSLWNRY